MRCSSLTETGLKMVNEREKLEEKLDEEKGNLGGFQTKKDNTEQHFCLSSPFQDCWG